MENRTDIAVEIEFEMLRLERAAFARVQTKIQAFNEGLDYPTERERRQVVRYAMAA